MERYCDNSADCEIIETADFESIFKNYYSSVYKYALTFTKDSDSAKDIVSDVFMQVWAKRETLTITSSLKSYLFAMVKHQALLEKRKLRILTDRADDYLRQQPEMQQGPLEQHISQQTAAGLEQLIDALPPLRREIIELRLFGLTHREIAETLEITEKKVEYQLSAAIETLRYQITRYSVGGIELPEGFGPRHKPALVASAVINILVMLS